jgi:hypothetical protein
MEGTVVLDKTPLYAEMGGQVADHGTIPRLGAVFDVTDVQKDKAGKFLHHGVMVRQPQGGRHRQRHPWTRAPQGDACAPTPPPICCRRRCRRSWATMCARPAPMWRGQAALRLHPLLRRQTEELMLVMSKVNDMILDGMDVWMGIKEMPIDEAKSEACGAMAPVRAMRSTATTVRVVNMGGKSHRILRRHPCGQHRQGAGQAARRPLPHHPRCARAAWPPACAASRPGFPCEVTIPIQSL